MLRTRRARRCLTVVTLTLGLVVALTAGAAATRWVVHDGGTVTSVGIAPSGTDFEVCSDQIFGLAGYANTTEPGQDPTTVPVPPSALVQVGYQVFSGPAGVDLFVNDEFTPYQVGYVDADGDFQQANLAASFTTAKREKQDPVELGTDWYVFASASFSTPLTGVSPNDTVGVKPHPNSPLATVAEWTAVDCRDTGFASWWQRDVDFCNAASARLLPGDVTGDRRADLVCNTRATGDLRVVKARTDGSFATPLVRSNTTTCRQSSGRLLLGDVDGDGRSDLICQDPNTGSIAVSRARQGGRFPQVDWQGTLSLCRATTSRTIVGDVNGDGRADLVCHRRTGALDVALANASGRFPTVSWRGDPGFCGTGNVRIGDLDGDGRDDLLCHQNQSGQNAVTLAKPGGTFGPTTWSGPLPGCAAGFNVSLARMDGNAREDLVCHSPSTGQVRIAYGRPGGKVPSLSFVRKMAFCGTPQGRLRVADVSADGRADLVCPESSTGVLSVAYSDL